MHCRSCVPHGKPCQQTVPHTRIPAPRADLFLCYLKNVWTSCLGLQQMVDCFNMCSGVIITVFRSRLCVILTLKMRAMLLKLTHGLSFAKLYSMHDTVRLETLFESNKTLELTQSAEDGDWIVLAKHSGLHHAFSSTSVFVRAGGELPIEPFKLFKKTRQYVRYFTTSWKRLFETCKTDSLTKHSSSFISSWRRLTSLSFVALARDDASAASDACDDLRHCQVFRRVLLLYLLRFCLPSYGKPLNSDGGGESEDTLTSSFEAWLTA